MTDLSRLLGDRHEPIDLRTEMLWYRCTNTFRAPRLGIRTVSLQLPNILLELQCQPLALVDVSSHCLV